MNALDFNWYQLNDNFKFVYVQMPLCFQSWGGKDNGFGLAECCKDVSISVSCM